jgi:hypothetical protein
VLIAGKALIGFTVEALRAFKDGVAALKSFPGSAATVTLPNSYEI